MDIRLRRNGTEYLLRRDRGGRVTLSGPESGGRALVVRRIPGGGYQVETPEGWIPAEAARGGDTVWVHLGGRTYRFELVRGQRKRTPGAGSLSSPMPGQVQKLLVAEGDTVEAGQPLLVVEAMKMQLEIKAPEAGRVRRLRVREGEQVMEGVPLAEMEPAT
jgi:biotin carboxyl carrier protein